MMEDSRAREERSGTGFWSVAQSVGTALFLGALWLLVQHVLATS